MSDTSTREQSSTGAPPRFADPRRTGTLIGLVGACVFVFSYTPGFSDPLSVVARIVVIAAVSATLWFLFVTPRFLGPFIPPRGWHVGVYVLCVLGEFALIAGGSRWLETMGRLELRPALIALVVGLHFLPFAWAFKEHMFYTLGGVLVLFGGLGLLIGTQASALGAAVGSGVIMALILLTYSLGFFAPSVLLGKEELLKGGPEGRR
ncbi:DUF7010 family protein [uncultured Arthrobacter sp.]|uniref:DUF7010 family protein n=1 Tax=uncultured Arthrobacter sp. TaxID=114050 RepID=UPI002635540D|nr:hypothetical protein [uncultured Arthrobacter sp.]